MQVGRGEGETPQAAPRESSRQAPLRAHPGGQAGPWSPCPGYGRVGHPARSQRALGRVRLSTLISINSEVSTLTVCAQMHAGERQDLAFRELPGRGSRPVTASNESSWCREARAWVEAAQSPGVQAAGRGPRQPDPCCPCEPVGGNAGECVWTSQRLGGPGRLCVGGAAAVQCGHRPGLSLSSPCPSSPLRWTVRLPLCPGKACVVSF